MFATEKTSHSFHLIFLFMFLLFSWSVYTFSCLKLFTGMPKNAFSSLISASLFLSMLSCFADTKARKWVRVALCMRQRNHSCPLSLSVLCMHVFLVNKFQFDEPSSSRCVLFAWGILLFELSRVFGLNYT